MNTKILIIGQAPPLQKQKVPYDTTMLYEWLEECNISKEQAQKIFIFDAVYNKFPGFENGKHKKPSLEEMDSYFPQLKDKIESVNKVWILGNVAFDYLSGKLSNKKVLYTMHPSRLNFNRYKNNKEKLVKLIKNFIYE